MAARPLNLKQIDARMSDLALSKSMMTMKDADTEAENLLIYALQDCATMLKVVDYASGVHIDNILASYELVTSRLKKREQRTTTGE